MKSLDTIFCEFDTVFSFIATSLSTLVKQTLLLLFLRPNLKYA